MWHGRKSETFKRMYANKKSFIVHLSYMIVVVAIYLGYSLLPGSRVIKEYPRLLHLAYGAHFLQGTLRVMISAAT
jgi:hypothetical protein